MSSTQLPVIRAVTGFMRTPHEWSREEVRDAFQEAALEVKEASERLRRAGFTVWTKRVVFPYPPIESYRWLADAVEDLVPRDYLVDLGPMYASQIDEAVLFDAVRRGFYLSIVGEVADEAYTISRIIHRVSIENPVYATRIAVSLGGDVPETPYFPLTKSRGVEGIGVSFLYPEVVGMLGSRGYRRTMRYVQRVTRLVRDTLHDKRVVIDYSVSPWMEQSVAGELEKMCGCSLGETGFLAAIKRVNMFLLNIVQRTPWAGGFNEVMLPLAEDNVLKEKARQGLVTARDYLLYSTVCVAGPDMLVLPSGVKKLMRYIQDAHSIASSLHKPLGLRVIIADAEPGEEIDLGRFGKTPVIPYGASTRKQQ